MENFPNDEPQELNVKTFLEDSELYYPDVYNENSMPVIQSGMEKYAKAKLHEQADKILSRLSVIFTDYKNAGLQNSANVTKYIISEIENIVKV